MSNERTNGNYTEARARYVMGKIFDDFHVIAYRGFDYLEANPEWLLKVYGDLFYLMSNHVLTSFQVKLTSNSGELWAVEFVIKPDGSLLYDTNSGRIDFWEIPANATINFPTKWTHGNGQIDNEMIKRGWTSKSASVTDYAINDATYSNHGFAATRGKRGAWNH